MTVINNYFENLYPDQILGDPKQLASIINEITYPNLYKPFSVASILSISCATCDRSFSAMRRVKTWLRSAMSQQRFSNLSMIRIERDVSNNIDSEYILCPLACANDKKIPLIY